MVCSRIFSGDTRIEQPAFRALGKEGYLCTGCATTCMIEGQARALPPPGGVPLSFSCDCFRSGCCLFAERAQTKKEVLPPGKLSSHHIRLDTNSWTLMHYTTIGSRLNQRLVTMTSRRAEDISTHVQRQALNNLSSPGEV